MNSAGQRGSKSTSSDITGTSKYPPFGLGFKFGPFGELSDVQRLCHGVVEQEEREVKRRDSMEDDEKVEDHVLPLTQYQKLRSLSLVSATQNLYTHILSNINGGSKSTELKDQKWEKEITAEAAGNYSLFSNSQAGSHLENSLSWLTKVLDVVLDSAAVPPSHFMADREADIEDVEPPEALTSTFFNGLLKRLTYPFNVASILIRDTADTIPKLGQESQTTDASMQDTRIGTIVSDPKQSATNLMVGSLQHLAGSDESPESCVRKIGANIFRTVGIAADTVIDVAAGSSDKQCHGSFSQLKTIACSPIRAIINLTDCVLGTATLKKLTAQEVQEKDRLEAEKAEEQIRRDAEELRASVEIAEIEELDYRPMRCARKIGIIGLTLLSIIGHFKYPGETRDVLVFH
jgi:hypothetical protein